jgi:hypothetical protein
VRNDGVRHAFKESIVDCHRPGACGQIVELPIAVTSHGWVDDGMKRSVQNSRMENINRITIKAEFSSSARLEKTDVPRCRRCSHFHERFVTIESDRGDAAIVGPVVREMLDLIVQPSNLERLTPCAHFHEIDISRAPVLVTNLH